ncbi:NRDE-2, necessary for RNA interference-domain-containing protein [Massariosphaeria phaeospora]|uniref:NRDE-2, necessary for RNA interference-domain-containing protein n=1 Tax=Massariosphaeria phaeospora TaxID=100035 RepID=A0A7C8IGX5_9PLEO|nr:NRDE-2, necessary for RNA interference-domain-containing protein [Massariosphaeria phaeospora]
MSTNIPKFASFRPKAKPPVEPKPNPLPVTTPQVEEPSKKELSSAISDRRSRVDGEAPHISYYSDRKGDRAILTYGTLNRYEIPTYRRHGYGRVIGLHPSCRIDPDLSTNAEIFVSQSKRRQEERPLANRHAIKGTGRSLRFVQSGNTFADDLDQDFVALSAVRRRRHKEDDSPDGHYNSLEQINASVEPSDSEADYEPDTAQSGPNAEVTLRNSLLIQRTHEDPTDIQAWQELIDHQEQMMKLDRDSSELGSSDRRHLADVRTSTYEKALRKIGPDQESQIKLHLGLMAEASRIWDEGKLTSKWADVLAKYPSKLELWMQYLDFVQSTFSSFKYENCRATFQNCCRISKASNGTAAPEEILHIIIRMTMMIQQAGYQELAIAIWQALLEFCLMKPSVSTSTGPEEYLSLFEEFWESEVPRIGEADAEGWRSFHADKHPLEPPTDSVSLDQPDLSASVFEVFRAQELDNIDKLRFPGRTTDKLGEDDAFHLILYSDIEDFLRILPQQLSSTLVLEAFLCFCHCPSLPGTDTHQAAWLLDPFICAYSPRPPLKAHVSDLFAQAAEKFLSCPSSWYRMTTEHLFDWGFPDDVDATLVRGVVKLLALKASSDEVVGEYLLGLESKYFPTDAFRSAKRLLKARPNSLRLYTAYGLVESRRGNPAKADQVFSAALAMHKSDTSFGVPGRLQLFDSWVWEALRRGETSEALWRLVSSHGEVSKRPENTRAEPDQTVLLRGRTILTEATERALLGQHYTTAVVCSSLLALLTYLSGGQDPQSALSFHQNLMSWFSDHKLSQSLAAELNAQSIAKFLQFHASNAPIVKPRLMRTTLEPLISQFPNNTILLGLYAANEARFSIDDRVRGIMQQTTLKSSKGNSIVRWFFAIYYETLKGEIAATSHSIRALFTKAEDDVGSHCPALWRSHVLFEIEEAKKERARRPTKRPRKDGKKRKDETRLEESYRRVKDTFLRGMTQLPWCKDYMMLAFTHLKEEFLNQEELRKVYDVMVEKELRLYVELEA